MISTSTGITYAGKHSSEYGILVAHIDTPTYQVGINNEIIFNKPTYSSKLYKYGLNPQPLEFVLKLFKNTNSNEHFTIEDRKNITGWLFQNEFQDLFFDNPEDDILPIDLCEDIVFNCIPNGQWESIDYGGLVGISVPFKCSLPYPTSNKIIQTFDLRNIGTNTIILDGVNYDPLKNYSNINSKYFWNTEVEIKLATGVTSITIKNLSDAGYTISFTGCVAGDTININNGLGILNAVSTTNIFSKWNKNWIRLVNGYNYWQITGACEITVKAKFPILI